MNYRQGAVSGVLPKQILYVNCGNYLSTPRRHFINGRSVLNQFTVQFHEMQQGTGRELESVIGMGRGMKAAESVSYIVLARTCL
jgi:hypothetical protein